LQEHGKFACPGIREWCSLVSAPAKTFSRNQDPQRSCGLRVNAYNSAVKSWELRAAMSMARLRSAQGKPQQVRELLAPVYDRFTEDFDTLDLKEAKALLEGLAA
jgi:predicted ATPase